VGIILYVAEGGRVYAHVFLLCIYIMELFLYLLLLGLAYYFTRVYLLKEHLTLEEVNTDYKKLHKKIGSLEEEYKSLQQKIDSQEKTMSKASAQASAINANLSNAIKTS